VAIGVHGVDQFKPRCCIKMIRVCGSRIDLVHISVDIPAAYNSNKELNITLYRGTLRQVSGRAEDERWLIAIRHIKNAQVDGIENRLGTLGLSLARSGPGASWRWTHLRAYAKVCTTTDLAAGKVQHDFAKP